MFSKQLSTIVLVWLSSIPLMAAEKPEVIDSSMTEVEAFEGLAADCPVELRQRQKLITLAYMGLDGKIHQGQLVIDRDLERDIQEIFAITLKEKFPIQSMIPMSHPKFRKEKSWDDNLSMLSNNTSAFNYRKITGGTSLSNHATGRAIDINPFLNPYIKGRSILPTGSKYDLTRPGTLSADHPVTKAFLARGWDWGGNWSALKDYQHFEKPSKKSEWINPAALKKGETIAFVAPAGPADPEKVSKAKARFESMGYQVKIPATLLTRRNFYLAGTDAERADEFNAAVKDPSVKAIFAIKGGFGLTRILDRVDYHAIRTNPKIICGFSDLTALHLAIAKNCRLITFHSPMPQFGLFRDGEGFDYSNKWFWQTVTGDAFKTKASDGFQVPLPEGRAKPRGLVAGKAQGRLVGGNLSLIAATMGTPVEIEAKGNILLLEDTGEKGYRVDRMLSQLRLAGHLERFAGVVLGTFDETNENELEALIQEYFKPLKVPVITNYPVGHTVFNATLPHGGLVEIDADTTTIRLLESPVRVD
jgi:muramoyltetrapeptide carboxypeptidase